MTKKKAKKEVTQGSNVETGKQGKAERFQYLTNKRVNAALQKIRLIGNLSNRASYEYTDLQVSHVFETLAGALKKTQSKFFAKEAQKEDTFTVISDKEVEIKKG